HQRERRPDGRAPAEAGVGVAPPQRQVEQRSDREDPRGRARDAPRAPGEPAVARAREHRRREADETRGERDGNEEEDGEVRRQNDRVADAADEAGQPRAEADRRRRPEQRAAQQADANAPADRDPDGAASPGRAAEYEPIDAGVEIPERPQLLPQLVDALVWFRSHRGAGAASPAAPALSVLRPFHLFRGSSYSVCSVACVYSVCSVYSVACVYSVCFVSFVACVYSVCSVYSVACVCSVCSVSSV